MNMNCCEQAVVDSEAEQFNALYCANHSYYGTAVPQEFTEFLAGRPADSLNCLDLGAGQGRYSLHMARAGAMVRAVDYSRVAMAQLAGVARAERLAIATEVADLCAYDFPVGEYDLIVGATVLDHLGDFCRKRLAVSMVTALRPGGVVYCEVFTTSDPGCGGSQGECCSETAGPVRYYFTTGELRQLFPQLTVASYREGMKKDLAHGAPHRHGLALLIGVKE
jgi:SAM-dependent methyltransferase